MPERVPGFFGDSEKIWNMCDIFAIAIGKPTLRILLRQSRLQTLLAVLRHGWTCVLCEDSCNPPL